ncbi:Hypothetical predicted protein [Mytilus galloprovincialis]|uniref:Uncharacterized protein n=1 Tax=Mytilus galloprovincialis TaxID=29158 RepID=A0A8B6DR66_MYTGA|nr:Hypothetical predicted protein [Mytilus galloprovincialis]
MSTATEMKTRRAGHRGVLTKLLLKKVEPSSEELLQEYDVSELSNHSRTYCEEAGNDRSTEREDCGGTTEEEVSEEIEEADRYKYDIEMSVTKLSKIIKESEITDKQSRAQRSFITQEMADLLNMRPHRKEAMSQDILEIK